MRLFVFIILVINKGYIIDCAKELKTLGRIINGHDAQTGQFPFAVRLDTMFGCCSGSLISPIWVLTAAHCVANSHAAAVHLGSNVRGLGEVVYHVPSINIQIHPGYKKTSVRNDIALIKIPFNPKFNEKICVVPLPSSRSIYKYEKAYARACGWGRTSKDGPMAKRLQWGRFQILDARECRYLGISKKEICTVACSELTTIWDGDSGAPLVLETTGELVGITTSLNIKSWKNGYPAVFTRITSYLDWIKSVSGISY